MGVSFGRFEFFVHKHTRPQFSPLLLLTLTGGQAFDSADTYPHPLFGHRAGLGKAVQRHSTSLLPFIDGRM